MGYIIPKSADSGRMNAKMDIPSKFIKKEQNGKEISPLFQSRHLTRVSSIVNEPIPQSTHETIAIPRMKSALLSGIECLQLGHLYCLSEVILATRQDPDSHVHALF